MQLRLCTVRSIWLCLSFSCVDSSQIRIIQSCTKENQEIRTQSSSTIVPRTWYPVNPDHVQRYAFDVLNLPRLHDPSNLFQPLPSSYLHSLLPHHWPSQQLLHCSLHSCNRTLKNFPSAKHLLAPGVRCGRHDDKRVGQVHHCCVHCRAGQRLHRASQNVAD